MPQRVTTAGYATARIFGGVALATTGVYATVTLAPVLASDLTGSTFLAGLPVAGLLAGAAGGAAGMARLIPRHGRARALAISYTVGAASCALALAAAALSLFPLLLLAMLGVGWGHAANQLARYAAAELHGRERQASVIGWIVWAQALGAVGGPLLLGPSGRLMTSIGGLAQQGPFLTGTCFFLLAAGLHARAGRSTDSSAVPGAAPADADRGAGVAAGGTWNRPAVQVAVAALVTSQVVMLLLMTMTPVHAHHAGHGLGTVGAILSAHTLGMFALAPLAGRLANRHGALPVVLGGLVVLAVGSVTAAAAPASADLLLGAALFLLGLGWSFTFVAASALLSGAVAAPERGAVQARVEAVTWSSGAAASVASGLLLGWTGFALLCLLGAAAVTVPALVIVHHRRSPTLRGASP